MTEDEELQGALVAATIDVIAESGYAALSIPAVAARAEIELDVVGGHFPDAATLVSVTMGWMYGDLAHRVGSRVEAEESGLPRVQAYIRAMNRYFFDNPKHIRVMGEVIGSGNLDGEPGIRPRERRWRAVAELLEDGQRHGRLGAFDTRAVAIVIGGAIDGLIVEWTEDPSFDLLAGTEELIDLVAGLTRGAAFASQ